MYQKWTHHFTPDWNWIFFFSAGYVAYFIAACVLNFQRAIALVVLTTLAVVFKSYELLKKYKGDSISEFFSPAVRCFNSNLRWIKWWVNAFQTFPAEEQGSDWGCVCCRFPGCSCWRLWCCCWCGSSWTPANVWSSWYRSEACACSFFWCSFSHHTGHRWVFFFFS